MLLFLDPVKSPYFSLEDGSNWKIPFDAVASVSKAMYKEASGKYPGKTKTIPYLSLPPLYYSSPYIYPCGIWYY